MKIVYKNCLLLVCVFVVVLAGCYKDKGNYDYKPINAVTSPVSVTVAVQVPAQGTTPYEYTPTITQTIQQNESNLLFEWQKYVTGAWVSYSKEKTLRFNIVAGTTTTSDYFRLRVTDSSINATYLYDVTVNYLQPYSRCWFVLQNNQDKSVLGAIENLGDQPIITADAYAKSQNGATIPGVPRYLLVNPEFLGSSWPFASLYVLTDQGGKFYHSATLAPVYDYTQFMRQFTGVPNPAAAYTSYRKSMILDNGELWQEGGAVRFYKAPVDAGIAPYRFTGAAASYYSYILFDDMGKRFFYYNALGTGYNGTLNLPDNPGVENKDKIIKIPSSTAYEAKFDPLTPGADKTFLYGGVSYTSSTLTPKSLMVLWSSTGANKLHLYEFASNGIRYGAEATFSGYWATTPLNATQTSKYATSFAFKRILFYTNGNKIYKLDYNTTTPTVSLVYSHPDQNATITAFKFRMEWVLPGSADASSPTYLGIGILNGAGEGSLVELHLKPSGDLVEGEPVREYKGFKKIVDIAYNYKGK